ncbi:hypothetical protein IQ265_06515 [Nodosilinea sp. LEGE 06152]|uniref:hypothetical protein n=1 Tax=Nodosilinea sp. LEGE 06152 TaxID=2777966 RepID=UPI00187F4712|nr:hypothetical protein [Nodosilinea sp. LEGE 06152]MBE9156482.1 hypothetical protein [Nodosilinea sp. LEGE 06152]
MDTKQYQALQDQINTISKAIQNLDRKSPDPSDRLPTFEEIVTEDNFMNGLRKGTAVFDVASNEGESQTFESLIEQSGL